MKKLVLTIDLLPKGAWDNNLSKTLPKRDWNLLRAITYEIANSKCTCCGRAGDLEAHEIWDFDIPTKTQTLTDIVALCPACHGVKHFRNSQRIGYGEHAKAHFIRTNKCSAETFAEHYMEAQSQFDERNKVNSWEMKAPLLDELGIRINPNQTPANDNWRF